MSCARRPPPPGFRCINCWQCSNIEPGKCQQIQAVNSLKVPPQTCEQMGVFSTESQCETKCSGRAKCYKCINGDCTTIYPKENGKPLEKCPNWPGVFTTLKECKANCSQGPGVKCWSKVSPESCKCTFGIANGANGPLKSCDSNVGFYDTESECTKSCKSPKSNKMIWIIIGVSLGVLLLLIIIAIVAYFIWKRHKSEE